MKWLKRTFLHLSIKQKWTSATALTIIVSYAIISGILYIAVHNWLINDEERTALRITKDVQEFFVSQGDRITVQDIQNNTSLINAIIEKEQTVRIFNFDDIEIIRINNSYASNPDKTVEHNIRTNSITKATINDTEVFAVYAPIQIGGFKGYMELIHPLSKFHSMMKYLLTMLLILGVGAIVVATTLSRYISSLLLKPIQQLRDSMVEVKEQGLYVEPQFSYVAEDEIGDLLKIYDAMIEELKESFTRQQQFVQDASHELRTPIQAIEGHLSLIDRWGKNDPEVLEESLKTSLQEIRRMKKLMEELLLLARNEEKQIGAESDVEIVLQSVKDDLQFLNPEAQIEITYVGEKTFAYVTENALAQIARNIIENAIRYSKEEIIVWVNVQYHAERIDIEIKDQGIGIADKHLSNIFNRFYRVDDSRKHIKGSTGLGLSITKMLADKYNVEINVSSIENSGTTFSLQIPTTFKK